VGLVGLGVVGTGVARLLLEDADLLTSRVGRPIELAHIVDIDLTRDRGLSIPDGLLTDDLDRLMNDASTTILVETVGGTTFAKDLVLRALCSGKDVVTANKALLAKHGKEIFGVARQHGRCVSFEASCGGGIPLIGPLCRGLLANRISAVYGILNGTCNYILTEMLGTGKAYADAVSEAMEAGFAEDPPDLDVGGYDTAHKLAIIASLAFGMSVDYDRITIEGITKLDLTDLKAGEELGYVCKLLAIGRRDDGRLSLRVHPAFIAAHHPLANTWGPFNAVSVYGHAVGHTLYYGRGAGQTPTASAVVSDVIDIAIGNAGRTFATLRIYPDVTESPTYQPIEEIVGRYYVRLMAHDRPGVMAQMTRVFGEHGISLSAIMQHEMPEEATDNAVPVVVLTHEAQEGDVQGALAELSQLDALTAEPVCIRVVEEHEEF
jgi:homoserine dehydrogenase